VGSRSARRAAGLRAVVAVAAWLGIAGAWPAVASAQRLGFDPDATYRAPRGGAHAEGPAGAPVTIVAWSDHGCGHCARAQHTLEGLGRLYPGQIRYVHRWLPLDPDHALAAEAALAAAAQGRFRPMSDRLYALRGRVDRLGVEQLARQLGLDLVRFRADLDAGRHRPQLERDARDAAQLGVIGTPTFFVNGRPVPGNQPLAVLAAAVDRELARPASELAAGYDALVASARPAADTPAARRARAELDPQQIYRVGLGLPGHAQGPEDALVTLVVWGDFQCPHCARMAPVIEQVRAKHSDTVRVAYRHLPMASHRQAALAAEAAVEAAAQGKLWPLYHLLVAQPDRLTRGDLEQLGAAAGLDGARLRAALDDRRHREAVAAEAAAAEALGVDGTPTIFVNGYPVVGTRDRAGLERIVDDHLARARAVIARGLPRRDLYALLMSGGIGDDRADPAAVPEITSARIVARAADRARAAVAACRRRDGARAAALGAGLDAAARRRTAAACAGLGVDLPPAP
jgi:protein-disulfide isomerase